MTAIAKLRKKLKETKRELKEEEERSKQLHQLREAQRGQPKGWYTADVETLDPNQLKELEGRYLELKKALQERISVVENSESSSQKPV